MWLARTFMGEVGAHNRGGACSPGLEAKTIEKDIALINQYAHVKLIVS